MTMSRTKKALISSILAFVVSLALFVGGIYIVNAKSVEIGELENKYQSDQETEAILKNLETTIRNNSENVEEINNFFISPETEVEFIKEVEKLATTTVDSFEIKSFSHKEITKNDKYEFAVLQAEATGSFREVFKFLILLENFPKESIMEQVELHRIYGDAKNAPVWKISFVMKAIKFR